jgi:S-adenosylmethionine:tRNA ribosyltransferase-isomerase
MKTSEFDYFLPKNLIAQNPAKPRDVSKLMVCRASFEHVEHKVFKDIKDLLKAGDVLVLNTSKVIPARIIFDGNKEIFLIKKIAKNTYECLVRPGRKFKRGAQFNINKAIQAEVVNILDDGERVIRFSSDFGDDLSQMLEKLGEAPLPPYITNTKASLKEYQTVYANEKGSVAAPTAGLHFTKDLLKSLKRKGVQIEKVVLHVGLGTFLTVTTDDVKDHVMHSEFLEMNELTAARLNKAKKEGRRIIAVGTTSVRVLESCFKPRKGFVPQISETSIFIYPGYKWKAVDALVTNFHLPKSTLLMLVASFLQNKGSKKPVKDLMKLYEIAKKHPYRFYSFGDAMFIF